MESTPQPGDFPITPDELAKSMGVENYKVSPVLTEDATPSSKAGKPLRRSGFGAISKGEPDKATRAIYLEYQSGEYTLQQLADKWGMGLSRIKKRVERVHAWMTRNWQKELGPMRSTQDVELQEVKTLALQAFQQSRQPRRVRKKVSGVNSGEQAGPYTRNEITIEETVGDPRFLNVALAALKQRSELWGIDAPRKTAMTNLSGDGPMQVEVLHKKLEMASDDTLRKLRSANRALQAIEHKQDVIDVDFAPKESGDADEGTTPATGDEPVRDGTGTGADECGRDVDESPDAAATHQPSG